MFAPSRGRTLGKVIESSSVVSLPSFLVPAFHTSPARQFSATTNRPSKLGRIPISIPPGVELSIGEPKIKKDFTTYLQVAKRTVTIQGPFGWWKLSWHLRAKLTDLGEQHLEIPPFLHIENDPTTRKATLSIEDPNQKQQKEMWGMKIHSIVKRHTGCWN